VCLTHATHPVIATVGRNHQLILLINHYTNIICIGNYYVLLFYFTTIWARHGNYNIYNPTVSFLSLLTYTYNKFRRRWVQQILIYIGTGHSGSDQFTFKI